MNERTCSEPDCDRPTRASGMRAVRNPDANDLCRMHYQRKWKAARACTIDGCDGVYAAKGMCILHYKRTLKGQSFDLPRLGFGKGAGCSVEGCDEPYGAIGYCYRHAARFRRTGDPLGFLKAWRPEACVVNDCDGKHFGLGYCEQHYHQNNRYGSPIRQLTCQECGEDFVRPLSRVGSFTYCPECIDGDPILAGARRRRDRVQANDSWMTDADRTEAAEYRGIILSDPCVYCGDAAVAVDHIVPVMSGGTSAWWNSAPVCQTCNSSKSARSLLAFLIFRAEDDRDVSRPVVIADVSEAAPLHREQQLALELGLWGDPGWEVDRGPGQVVDLHSGRCA